MERVTEQERSRFNSKWITKGDCRLWQSPLDKDGYGTFYFRRLNRRAHRVAYYIDIGDIPEGMVIDHICGIRNCVSSAHLRVLTPKENALDGRGLGAINARKQHCKNGHPFDRFYSNQRCCSICEAAKSRRLQAKWRAEDATMC